MIKCLPSLDKAAKAVLSKLRLNFPPSIMFLRRSFSSFTKKISNIKTRINYFLN